MPKYCVEDLISKIQKGKIAKAKNPRHSQLLNQTTRNFAESSINSSRAMARLSIGRKFKLPKLDVDVFGTTNYSKTDRDTSTQSPGYIRTAAFNDAYGDQGLATPNAPKNQAQKTQKWMSNTFCGDGSDLNIRARLGKTMRQLKQQQMAKTDSEASMGFIPENMKMRRILKPKGQLDQ